MPISDAPFAPLDPDPPFPTTTAGCWQLGRELYKDFRPFERTITDLHRAREQITPDIRFYRTMLDHLGGSRTKTGREYQLKHTKLVDKDNRVEGKLAEYARLRNRLRALSRHMQDKNLLTRERPTFPLNL